MKQEDKDRLQRERKEYNRTRDQDRKIQQLQQQLNTANSVRVSVPTDLSVGQVSQITEGTQRQPGSTMFGARNEQANFRRGRGRGF
jgi:transcription elongation GreA/GreB family factor